MQTRILVAIGLLLGLPISGCLDAYEAFEEFDTDGQYRNAGVFEGYYQRGGQGSYPLMQGTLRPAQRPEVVTLESERPAYGAAAPVLGATGVLGGISGSGSGGDDSRVDIKMAIWRPDNYTAPTPIIVDAGPYFEQDNLTIENQTQSTPLLVQNMLPRGYTVVQLAVRGTGTSGGCVDLFGPDETADLDQALTWLGEQPWSNGRIGMIGVSYDGSTPWSAAGTGNPYLKTIVPISGLPDMYDLMLHNGSAETRAAIMHGLQVYWGYGFSKQFPSSIDPVGVRPTWEQLIEPLLGQPWPVPPAATVGTANGRHEYQDRQNLLCPEALEGQAVGQASAAEGSRLDPATTYWTERDHRDDVLANYQGSVFLIHGLQDWNVDPHSAIPFNVALRAKGLEVKEWYGQWDHTTPDGNCDPGAPEWSVAPCRLDYGEVLARWFDKHLMGYPSILNCDPALFEDADLREAMLAAGDDLAARWALLEAEFGDLLDTGPAIQVQDSLGFWRNADSYPPAAPAWVPLALGADGALVRDATGIVPGQATLKAPAPGTPLGVTTGALPTNALQFVSQPFPDGLHISGMPQVKVPFSVSGQGGFLAAWLYDMDPNGLVRSPAIVQVPIAPGSNVTTWAAAGVPVVGHAQMNLRYYAGGEEPQPLVAGQRYVAQVEFEPLEVHIPKGHRVALWLFQYPYPEHSAATTPADVTVTFDGEAQLLLPTVDLDPRTVFPVPSVSFPNTTVVPQMYVHLPILDGVATPGAPQGAAASSASSSPSPSPTPRTESAPLPAAPTAPQGHLGGQAVRCLPGTRCGA